MIRVYIYPILIILYLFSNLMPTPSLLHIVGILSNITILISLFFARGLYLISGIIFYIIGFVLFSLDDSSWHTYFLHFDSMLGIMSLFLLLPFLNALIRVGRYDTHLSLFLKHKVVHVSDLYKHGSFVSHTLGLFLNIATIPLLLRSLSNTLKHLPAKITYKFYTQTLLRAYALCLTWSPLEIMVIQSLEITQENYLYVFPFMFLIAALMLFIDWRLAKGKYQHLYLPAASETVLFRSIVKKIRELFFLLIFLVLSVTLLNHAIKQSYLFSLVILIIPISLLWAVFIRKVKRYLALSIPHWKTRTKGLSNYFFMFLSAGFFVEMLSTTNLIVVAQSMFNTLTDYAFLFYLMIGAYFFVLAFVGFHPLVSIVLLAEILTPILSEVAGISLTLVLIACSLSTVMYSPFNISVSILGDQLKVNPYRLGVWNIKYSLFYMFFTICIAYLLNLIVTL